MRKVILSVALATSLLASTAIAAHAQEVAQPQLAFAVDDGRDAGSLQTVDYVWSGQRYCWYGAGWHGQGYYHCGYGWRRGQGWGGGPGFHGWRDGGRWDGNHHHHWRHHDGDGQDGGYRGPGEHN